MISIDKSPHKLANHEMYELNMNAVNVQALTFSYSLKSWPSRHHHARQIFSLHHSSLHFYNHHLFRQNHPHRHAVLRFVCEMISGGYVDINTSPVIMDRKADVPGGTSSSEANDTCLPTLTTSPTLVSYKNRFMCKMSTGGRASMSTCC